MITFLREFELMADPIVAKIRADKQLRRHPILKELDHWYNYVSVTPDKVAREGFRTFGYMILDEMDGLSRSTKQFILFRMFCTCPDACWATDATPWLRKE